MRRWYSGLKQVEAAYCSKVEKLKALQEKGRCAVLASCRYLVVGGPAAAVAPTVALNRDSPALTLANRVCIMRESWAIFSRSLLSVKIKKNRAQVDVAWEDEAPARNIGAALSISSQSD